MEANNIIDNEQQVEQAEQEQHQADADNANINNNDDDDDARRRTRRLKLISVLERNNQFSFLKRNKNDELVRDS